METANRLPTAKEMLLGTVQNIKTNLPALTKPVTTYVGIYFACVLVDYLLSNRLLSIAVGLIVDISSIWIMIEVAQIIKKKQANDTSANTAILLLPVAVITSLLLAVLNGLLYLLLIIPGIIFSVYWAFTLMAVALSNKKYMEALSYSRSLVNNRWWMTAAYLLLMGFIVGVGMLILMLPVVAASHGAVIDSESLDVFTTTHLGAGLYTALVNCLAGIVAYVYTALLFLRYEALGPKITPTNSAPAPQQ